MPMGNPYVGLRHKCDINRHTDTSGEDEFGQPQAAFVLTYKDVPCRYITYPRLSHAETDTIRSAGAVMGRFWIDPAITPLIGDQIVNIRDRFDTIINLPEMDIIKVSPAVSDTLDRTVCDCNGTVAGPY